MGPNAEIERQKQYQKLVDLLLSIKPETFSQFDISRTHYESKAGMVGVDILIPRDLEANKFLHRPVMVRIHGGFLITGSSLFPAWFGKWILDFAQLHGAIIVSPNYRLLPEVRGLDILEDMRAFWGWMNNGGAQRHLNGVNSSIKLDAGRTLLVGESAAAAAGGYLAVQSVLNQFTHPRALLLPYPMLDMSSDYYCKSFDKPIVGVPNFPETVVDEFLSTNSGKDAITEADPPSRLEFALAAVQTGRYRQFLGDSPELFPIERIRKIGLSPSTSGSGVGFPPTFILHGQQDSAVPLSGTEQFVALVKQADPTVQLRLAIRPGDHGFDAFATLDEPWLKQGLDFIAHAWQVSTLAPRESSL